MEVKKTAPMPAQLPGRPTQFIKILARMRLIFKRKRARCLPEDCAADIGRFCEEQSIAYDNFWRTPPCPTFRTSTPRTRPSRDTLKFELLTLTNRCIDAYNLGKRDPNAAPERSWKDAYPDEKQGAERCKRLSGLHSLQIAIVLRELHHAIGMPLQQG